MTARWVTGLAAAVLAAASIGCLAQPLAGAGAPLRVLAGVKQQLNLNTSQQQLWDQIAAQALAAREATRANRGQLKAALQAELAKPEPDLAALAANADAVRQQNEAARKSVRAAWLGLYATFTPEQKTVVRDTLSAALARMEAWRQRRAIPPPSSN